MSEDRQCASGLMAVAIGAKQIVIDGQEAVAGGGMELISLVQIEPINGYRAQGPWLVEHRPDLYMPMLETTEIVALRYSVTREMQDAYALQSQQRHAAAQAERRPAAEIVPLPSRMLLPSREGENEPGTRDVVLEADEGPRPGTALADLEKLRHALKDGQELKEGRTVTAGNASQLSDSAAALVLIEAGETARRGLRPLGAYRGMAVAVCDPDEMGIGPVHAVPKLLRAQGLTMDDIGVWELKEAFASQVLYCRDRLGIPSERLNVSGGAIAMGHP
jgi:acetyl-CoA C-acetyltransferase